MEFFVRQCNKCLLVFIFCLGFSVAEVQAEIEIPARGDWTDRGAVITAGSGWDKRLHGAIGPGAIVKRNGTIYLYYIGADGNRSTDGGPRNRALGVATSQNGLNFTKYSGNPVIRHQPHNNQEEGVFSATATLDGSGNIVLYYGALWAANSTTESVDVYVALATSSNGFSFNNRGASGQYAYKESGNEVDPIGVTQHSGTWYVYYINNNGWKLNLLSGSSIGSLSRVGSVSGTGGTAKGGGDPILLDGANFVSFIDHYDSRDTLVMTGSMNNPRQLTQVDRYGWGGGNHKHTVTFLDPDLQTWFMYYINKDQNFIGVKTAPVKNVGGGGGSEDATPPASPESVSVN